MAPTLTSNRVRSSDLALNLYYEHFTRNAYGPMWGTPWCDESYLTIVSNLLSQAGEQADTWRLDTSPAAAQKCSPFVALLNKLQYKVDGRPNKSLKRGNGRERVWLKALVFLLKAASLCGVRCHTFHNCVQEKKSRESDIVLKNTPFLVFKIYNQQREWRFRGNNRWSAARCWDAAPAPVQQPGRCRDPAWRWSSSRRLVLLSKCSSGWVC